MRFRTGWWCVLGGLVVLCGVSDAADLVSLRDRVSLENLETHVEALAKTPRYSVEQRDKSRDYIEGLFRQYGYDTERQAFGTDGVNLIARKAGKTSSDVLVLSAHYDSVDGSPGADDNASAVACLLEAARVCSGCEFERTIEIVAFDLEEAGALGSHHYVNQVLANKVTITGCINMDMIGYTQAKPIHALGSIEGCVTNEPASVKTPALLDRPEYVGVLANTGSPGASSIFLQDAYLKQVEDHVEGLPVVKGMVAGKGGCFADGVRSDHAVFWYYGLPALFVTDTAFYRNPHYHEETDTPCTLDYIYHWKVVQATILTFMQVAGVSTYAAPKVLAPLRLSIDNSRALLWADFYDGDSGSPADDLTVNAGYPSHGKNLVAFWAIRKASNEAAIHVVDLNDVEMAHRITDFETVQEGGLPSLTWTPDDKSIVAGNRIVHLDGYAVQPLHPFEPHGHIVGGEGSFTSLPADNWFFEVAGRNIWALPVGGERGQSDFRRRAVIVTHFTPETAGTITNVSVSDDGRALTFVATRGEVATLYSIPNLQTILKAERDTPTTLFSAKAPTSYDDSALLSLHTFRGRPAESVISRNGAEVFFVDNCGTRDTDIFVRDVLGKRPRRRISSPGPQGLAVPYLVGSQVVYTSGNGEASDLLLGALRVTVPAWGERPMAEVTVGDGNRTSLTIPAGTVITFPKGAAEEVSLETPVGTIDPSRFRAGLSATQAARTIGPDGAMFSKPVTVTMQYSEHELGDVELLVPFVVGRDSSTGLYDLEIESRNVVHDAATRTVRFQTRFATTYVLASGGELE